MNTVLKVNPEELFVEEIMRNDFITIAPNKSISDAADLMLKSNIGMLPIVENNDVLLGVVTDRDIVLRVIAKRKDPNKTKVSECMTQNPCRTVPRMNCVDAMFMMSGLNVRRLLVVKGHKLVGVVSYTDIAEKFDFCPNTKCPKENCILINIADALRKTSHLYKPSQDS